MITFERMNKKVKHVMMIMPYGASFKSAARSSKLGLRRTRVLYKKHGYLKAKVVSSQDFINGIA